MLRRLTLALLAGTALAPAAAYAQAQNPALPTGGSVVAGSASIATPTRGAMTITQGTDRAIIDWTNFSIGAGGTVTIAQPGSTSALLNRVTGTATSEIAGQLNANGRVFLVNPNGILITKTGSVNAAGFTASTLDIANKDFMAGSDELTVVAPSRVHEASVVRGGFAGVLQGRTKTGLVIARVAQVKDGGAALDLSGDGFLQVAVPQGGINVAGRITANQVVLTAGTAQQAARGVVNLTGTIQATGVTGHGGIVTLTGASVNLTGATIDASGATGGGSVTIGGGRQGSGTLAHATTVSIDATSSIRADATSSGNGGQVTLWSDGMTDFAGAISAKGSGGGNGGDAEVSGHVLGYAGTADLTGKTFGTLLLDPYNVTISTAADSNQSGFTATGSGSTINTTTLQNALATANVTVSTGTSGTQDGLIYLGAPLTWNSASTLTLRAASVVELDSTVNAPSGGLTVNAVGGISITANLSVNQLALNSAGMNDAIEQNGTSTISATTASLTANTISLSSSSNQFGTITSINAAGNAPGSVSIANGQALTIGSVAGASQVTLTAVGNLTVSSALSATNDISLKAGGAFGTLSVPALSSQIGIITLEATSFAAGGAINAGSQVNVLIDGSGSVGEAGTVPQAMLSQINTRALAIQSVGPTSDLTINSVAFRPGNLHLTAGRNLIFADNKSISAVNLAIAAGGTISGGATSSIAVIGGLSGSANGAINLSGATNSIAALGGFDTTNGGSNPAGASLALTNAVAGRFSLFGPITLGTGGTLSLVDTGGSISQASGTITAAALSGSASGGASFTQNNAIATLNGFSDINNGNLSLTDRVAALGLTGAINIGTGTLTLTDTSGTISQTGGTITAGTLTGSAGGAVSLGANNAIANLGAFATTNGSIAIGTSGPLNVSGAVAAGGSQNVTIQSGGDLYLAQNASIAGNTVTLAAGGNFQNGGGTVSASNRWLIYSTNPASNTPGGLTPDFIQYDASFGVATPAQPGGNGFLYTLAPVLTVGLTGSVAKTYDGTTSATLTNANYLLSGGINGDAITLITPTSGTFDTANAGQGKTVSASGISFAAANGGATVYGYQLATTASGAVGRIDPATLTYSAAAASRVYGAGNPTLTGIVTGFVNNETLASATTGTLAFTTTANGATGVGAYALTGSGLSANNGNYVFAQAPTNAAALTITPRSIFVSPDSKSRTYGDANPILTYIVSGLVNGDTLSGSLATNATAGSNVGLYDITPGTLAASSNYLLTVFPGFSLFQVTPRPITVTANAQSRVYGNANPALTYSVNGLVAGDTLAGTLATAATATSNVAGYAITGGTLASGVNPNYAISYTGATLSVTPRALTITPSALSRVYGNANPASDTATGDNLINGDAVTGISLTSPATLASGVGTYTLIGFAATGIGLGNYAITYATLANGLTVTPRALTITPDATTRIYGNANPASGTATGDNLVNGDAVTGISLTSPATPASGIGTYALTGLAATGIGLGNYAITYATLANGLTVTPRALTITPDATSRIYGNANPTSGTATGDNLVNGDAVTGISLTSPATLASGVGTYALTGSAATGIGLGNYAITYAALTNGLTITPRAITITADAQTRIYGNANPALTYTVGGLGLVNGDTLSGTLAPGATTASDVGNYLIGQGGLQASDNYALNYIGANLSITQRPLVVTSQATSRIYGSANPVFDYIVVGLGLVGGDALQGSIASNATPASGVGVYLTNQGSLSAGGNYALSFIPGTLSVTPRIITVIADPQSRIYGDANPTLTYAVGGMGLVNGDTLTGGLATVAGATSNVGTYGITQGSLAAGANYALTYQGAALMVSQRPLSVLYTASSTSSTYGNVPTGLTGTVTSQGLVNGDALTGSAGWTTAANATSGVGSYGITGSGVTASGNYALTSSQGAGNAAALTITARPLTVTADGQSRPYGEANPALTYAVGGMGLVNGDMLTGGLATAAAATSNVGGYAITQGSLAASANYALTYQGAALTVTQRPLSVLYTATAASSTYGNVPTGLTGTVTSQGLVNGDALNGSAGWTTTAGATSGVGSYGVTGSGVTASGNYALTSSQAAGNATALTITARPLTVTADGHSRVYGDANPALTYAMAGMGLVNGDTLSGGLATSAGATSNVGTYGITQGSLAAGANYALTYQGADLMVTQRPLSVLYTATAASSPYGNVPGGLTGTVTSQGLVNGDALTGSAGWTTTAGATSGVGSYGITGSGVTASGNYALTSSQAAGNAAALKITARPLTVTADGQSRPYGEANPALTYAVGGMGLVNGDTLSGGLATSAGATSNVGTYGITQGSLAAGANYALTYQGAALTVTPRPLSVLYTATAASSTYGNVPAGLTGTVTSQGLVNGDALTGSVGWMTTAGATSGVGNYGITGSGVGASGNYTLTSSQAAANATALTITARPLTVSAGAQSRVYGDANPALTYAVGGMGLVNGDTLTGGLATAAGATSNVGTYGITQGSLAASANYALTYQGALLTVTQRPLSVLYTATSASSTYGNVPTGLIGTVVSQGLVNGDALTGSAGWTTAANTTSGVGSYGITGLGIGASSNYALTSSQAAGNAIALTITARPLTVSAGAQSRVYGDANPALTYAVGGMGLVNGDTLTGGLATTADATSNVGGYAITQGSLAASANYSLAYQGATLTIIPRILIISADPMTRAFGDANLPLTYTLSGLGLVNGDRLSGMLSTPALQTSVPGIYAISQGTLAASANYQVSFVAGKLVIGASRSVSPIARAASQTRDGFAQGTTPSTDAGTLVESSLSATAEPVARHRPLCPKRQACPTPGSNTVVLH